ncbi:MAG: ArsR/SmtB family transcription factor [Patescibacteria group bacterium]
MKPECRNKKFNSEISQLSVFLKIISEDNRLKILCLLRRGECCVCEIYENLDLAQNLASSHLRVLKDFGLIKIRQVGKRNYYSINHKLFIKYNSILNKFLESYEK